MEQKRTKKTSLSYDALSVLCWQLSLLCRAGVPSADSVGMLAADAEDSSSRILLGHLRQQLDGGLSLSAALTQAGGFSSYFLNMIAIGEASGRTDQVLAALADYYHREDATERATRRAVTYPAIMGVFVALVFLVLISRVLPVFQQVFAQLGMTASGLAGGLISLGDSGTVIAVLLVVLLSVTALILLGIFYLPWGAGLRHNILNHGAMGRALFRSQFASAMSLMLSSGLSLDEALSRTAELLSDTPLAPAVTRCRKELEQGKPFVKSIETAGLLSNMETGLLTAGFQAGVLEQAMGEVALRCQTEADDRLSRFVSRFEYGLICLLCGGVGLLLLSLMLPLLGALSALGG